MAKPDTNVLVANDPLNVQVTNTTPIAVTGSLTPVDRPVPLSEILQLAISTAAPMTGPVHFTVPAGHALVIETATFQGSAETPNGNIMPFINSAFLTIWRGGSPLFYVPIPLTRQGNTYDAGYISGKVYLLPGDGLFCQGSVLGFFSIFGRLITVR